METLNIQLQPFIEWLLRTTLQASLLICLIILVQTILRGRLGIRWHYCLWLLLLVRMVMPWSPNSRVSLYNLIPQSITPQQFEDAGQAISNVSTSPDTTVTGTGETIQTTANSAVQAVETESYLAPDTITELNSQEPVTNAPLFRPEPDNWLRRSFFQIVNVIPIIWLAGALLLAVYICVGNFNLWRIVKQQHPLTNQKILDLLEDCKDQMGVQTILGIVPTDKVNSPALFGFIRPRLLLPQVMLETLSQQEQRYILLHELAHLKRHDIYIGWLTSLLQILHWFNPLVWLAFYRMRSDRELACDALVLTRTKSIHAKDYGGVIVGLVERFSQIRRLPAMAGIMENKTQLKRRITMISKFKKNSYQWSPLAILLIIILGCVSLPDAISTKVSDSSTSQSAPPIMIRRVWADADGNLEGAPSPDGRYLSYVDWETGDLAIYEIDTGKKRRLTNKGTWEESYEFAQYSKWSPDGKKIVYNWFNENSFFELRIIDLDGTKPRILYRNEEVEYLQPCDWSPDGKQVLAGFDKKDGNQIVLVSVADGSVRVLKTVDKSYPDASFSPDGRYIVNTYRQIEELYQSNRDISLISTDGSREIPLVEHPADDFVLGWAPDGKKILFASDRTGTLGVWLIAVADEEPQGAQEMLKPDIGQLEPLGFTQKGSFYYGFSRKSDDIYVATLDQQTGKIIAPLEKAIQRYEGSNIAAAYSPDGKYLAYIRRSGTLTQHSGYILCVHSLETDKQRDFTLNFTLGPNVPRWSPNGRSLLVVGNKDNIKGLYQIDTQTGGVKLVVPQVREDGSSFNSFDWSADGESIFYVHLYKLCRILVRDLANSIEKELYRSEDDVYSPYRIAVSSDGKWLALNSQLPDEGLGSLKVIQVTGGEAQELCKFEENFGALTLSADGKYIFFARKVSDDLEELCRITTEGGEIEKLGLEMKQIQSLSVHPDGQHILVSGQESATESEVWVMENFLPEAPVAKSVMAPKFTKIQIPNRISQYSQLSYDGKSIAFVNDDKIWIMPMSSRLGPGYSGEPRLLDTGEVLVDRIDLTWSGDSKWIAFNGKQVENGCQKIYIVSADGGEPKQVHENNRHSIVLNYRMSLSPDGKTLAFSTFDGHGIYIETISVEGGLPKRLVDAPAREPVFSPDGHIIAYVENKNLGAGGGSLWTIPASGGTPTLIADANNASSPVWSPEGRMIAFIDYGAGFQIYLVPVTEDGRAAGEKFKLELPEGTEGATCLTGWTPDNKITALYAKKEEFALYTRRIENGKASFITVGGYPMQPRWSPDGKLIYHTNNLDDTSGDWERYAIAYVPSEGGDVTTIPIKSEDNITIWGYGAGNRVSPDGKTIVFAGQTVQEENLNRLNIWTIPTEGGEPEQLTSPPPGFTDWYPCWSHDGQDIVFVRQNLSDDQTWSTPEEGSIYVVSSEGGEPSRITWESDRVYSAGPVLWSPDGELLAFYSLDKDKVDGALCVIRPNGGELKVVANVESKKELAWSPDSKRIAFQGSEEGVIKIVSLEDGNLREIKVDLVDTEIYHLDWSPDGESLAFAGYSGGGTEFWMMENFIQKSVAVADE